MSIQKVVLDANVLYGSFSLKSFSNWPHKFCHAHARETSLVLLENTLK